jgi:hypothetical protein
VDLDERVGGITGEEEVIGGAPAALEGADQAEHVVELRRQVEDVLVGGVELGLLCVYGSIGVVVLVDASS